MNSYYKPGGYNTASPYLIVNGAAQTIDFLVKAFGAVEIRIEDSFLMLADGDEDWPTAPSNVHNLCAGCGCDL